MKFFSFQVAGTHMFFEYAAKHFKDITTGESSLSQQFGDDCPSLCLIVSARNEEAARNKVDKVNSYFRKKFAPISKLREKMIEKYEDSEFAEDNSDTAQQMKDFCKANNIKVKDLVFVDIIADHYDNHTFTLDEIYSADPYLEEGENEEEDEEDEW